MPILPNTQIKRLLEADHGNDDTSFDQHLQGFTNDDLVECVVLTDRGEINFEQGRCKKLYDIAYHRLLKMLRELTPSADHKHQSRVLSLLAVRGVKKAIFFEPGSQLRQNLPDEIVHLCYVRDGFKHLMRNVDNNPSLSLLLGGRRPIESIFEALLRQPTFWSALPAVRLQLMEGADWTDCRYGISGALTSNIINRLSTLSVKGEVDVLLRLTRHFIFEPDSFPYEGAFIDAVANQQHIDAMVADKGVAEMIGTKINEWHYQHRWCRRDGWVIGDKDCRLALHYLINYLPKYITHVASRLDQPGASLKRMERQSLTRELTSLRHYVGKLLDIPEIRGVLVRWRSMHPSLAQRLPESYPDPHATDPNHPLQGLRQLLATILDPGLQQRTQVTEREPGLRDATIIADLENESSITPLTSEQVAVLNRAKLLYGPEFEMLELDGVYALIERKIKELYDADPIKITVALRQDDAETAVDGEAEGNNCLNFFHWFRISPNTRELTLPLFYTREQFDAWALTELLTEQEKVRAWQAHLSHRIHGGFRVLVLSYRGKNNDKLTVNPWLASRGYALYADWHSGDKGCANISSYKETYAYAALSALDEDEESLRGTVFWHPFVTTLAIVYARADQADREQYDQTIAQIQKEINASKKDQARQDELFGQYEDCRRQFVWSQLKISQDVIDDHKKDIDEIQRRIDACKVCNPAAKQKVIAERDAAKDDFIWRSLDESTRQQALADMAKARFEECVTSAGDAGRSHNRDGHAKLDDGEGDKPGCYVGHRQPSIRPMMANSRVTQPKQMVHFDDISYEIELKVYAGWTHALKGKLEKVSEDQLGEDYYKATIEYDTAPARKYNLDAETIDTVINDAIDEATDNVQRIVLTQTQVSELQRRSKKWPILLGNDHLMSLAGRDSSLSQLLVNLEGYRRAEEAAVQRDADNVLSKVRTVIEKIPPTLESSVDSTKTRTHPLFMFDLLEMRSALLEIIESSITAPSDALGTLRLTCYRQATARRGTCLAFAYDTPVTKLFRQIADIIFDANVGLLPPSELSSSPSFPVDVAIDPDESRPMPLSTVWAISKHLQASIGCGEKSSVAQLSKGFWQELPIINRAQLSFAIAITQGTNAVDACVGDDAHGENHSNDDLWLRELSLQQVLRVITTLKQEVSDDTIEALLHRMHHQWTANQKYYFMLLLLDEPRQLKRILGLSGGDKLLAAGLENPDYSLADYIEDQCCHILYSIFSAEPYLPSKRCYVERTDSLFESHPQALAVVFDRPRALATAILGSEPENDSAKAALIYALGDKSYSAFDQDPPLAKLAAIKLDRMRLSHDECDKVIKGEVAGGGVAIARLLQAGPVEKWLTRLSPPIVQTMGNDALDDILPDLLRHIHAADLPSSVRWKAYIELYRVVTDPDCYAEDWYLPYAKVAITNTRHRVAVDLLAELPVYYYIALIWTMRRSRHPAMFVYHLCMQKPSRVTPIVAPFIFIGVLLLFFYNLVSAAVYAIPMAIVVGASVCLPVGFLEVLPLVLVIDCCFNGSLVRELSNIFRQALPELIGVMTNSSFALCSASFGFFLEFSPIWILLSKLLAHALPIALLGTAMAVSFAFIPLSAAVAAFLVYVIYYYMTVTLGEPLDLPPTAEEAAARQRSLANDTESVDDQPSGFNYSSDVASLLANCVFGGSGAGVESATGASDASSSAVDEGGDPLGDTSSENGALCSCLGLW